MGKKLGDLLDAAHRHLLLLVLRIFARRTPASGVRRSLWSGKPILTLPVKAKAERLLGIEAETLVYEAYFITRNFTYNLAPILSALRWTLVFRHVARRLFKYAVFVWACARYDRFHFFCDQGLLPTTGHQFNRMELQLLRALGKEVFLYAYGADVRTADATRRLGSPNCCTECPAPGKSCMCDDALGQEQQAYLRQYATAIFSLGDMIHYTPGSRNDLFYWPIDLEAEDGKRYQPHYPDPATDRPIRIAHAPNHRGFKGTRYVIDAVEQLRREGLNVELLLVEGVPNAQALEMYRSADIVFDQCLIGFHGYFALEAMALGKPVVVFIRDPDHYLLASAECPFVNTSAGSVADTLRDLVMDRAGLLAIGQRGRAYIEKYFSTPAFAARLKNVLSNTRSSRDDIPSIDWPVKKNVA